MRKNNLIGQHFSRIVVVADGGRDRKQNVLWKCQCACGNISLVHAYDLKSGKVKSCGCYARDRRPRTHGMARAGKERSPTYSVWAAMVQRCTNENDKNWHNYGGRGVTVCDRWRTSFENFFADMGAKPDGYSIERQDVDGNYEPNNCEWIPRAEQGKNTRRSRWIESSGEKMILADWAKKLGVSRQAIIYWVRKGNTYAEAVERIARKSGR